MTIWTELTVAVYGPKDHPFTSIHPLGWWTMQHVTIKQAEDEAKARYPEAAEIEIEVGDGVVTQAAA